MKQALLEYIIRSCVKEVLAQVNENDLSAKTFDDSFKIPEKDLPFVQDLMAKHNLSYEEAVRDYLEMYGANQSGKPIKFSDQSSHIGRRFNEGDDDTIGAPAPPADGLGTADQPPVPKNDGEPSTEPEKKETPPAQTNLKGVILVSPRDKSSVRQVPLRAGDDAGIERNLHAVAAALAGPNVKIAISTMRAVKNALSNPAASVYVYLGKYDPESEEIFLMADKSLQVAKDSSIEPSDVQGSTFSSKSAPEHPDDIATGMLNKGYNQPNDPIDENLKSSIKKMVNQLLDGR